MRNNPATIQEYDELKKRLQKLREIHNKLVSSSNVSRDSNEVSPRRTLVEVAELSSNLNDDSLTNLKSIDKHSEDTFSNQQISSNNRSIISETAYNKVSHSLDYDQNNGWFEHKNGPMREKHDDFSRFSHNNSQKNDDSGILVI